MVFIAHNKSLSQLLKVVAVLCCSDTQLQMTAWTKGFAKISVAR
jgi:hypothetical protein